MREVSLLGQLKEMTIGRDTWDRVSKDNFGGAVGSDVPGVFGLCFLL